MSEELLSYDKYGEWVDGQWQPYDDMEAIWTDQTS